MNCIAGALVAGVVLCTATTTARQSPDLATLLQRAGTYLTDYERQMSMVVAEEQYTQISRPTGISSSQRRLLRSDLLVVDGGSDGWFGFRDVYEVDGNPVRDHQNRLLELVLSSEADPLTRAQRFADEGARFNLGGITRTINLPTIALMFLRQSNQDRSTWSFTGLKKIDGREVAELRFVEKATPRAIRTLDDAAGHGRFWIEPQVGRVVRSQLEIDSAGLTAQVTVTFGPAPNITAWVPLSMDDSCRATTSTMTAIDAHATYKNCRAFGVESNVVIKRF